MVFQHFVDTADHVKQVFGNGVVLAFEDLPGSAYGFFERNVATLSTGEDLGNEHGLGQETQHFTCACHVEFVFVGEFFDAQDVDDILKFLVALDELLHAACDPIMCLANDIGIEQAAGRCQCIHCREKRLLKQGAFQHHCRVEMSKGCRRCGV